jgi:hypothetical protein
LAKVIAGATVKQTAKQSRGKPDAWERAAQLAMSDYAEYEHDLYGLTCPAGFPKAFKRDSQPAVGGGIIVTFTKDDRAGCVVWVWIEHSHGSVYSATVETGGEPKLSYGVDISNGAVERYTH